MQAQAVRQAVERAVPDGEDWLVVLEQLKRRRDTERLLDVTCGRPRAVGSTWQCTAQLKCAAFWARPGAQQVLLTVAQVICSLQQHCRGKRHVRMRSSLLVWHGRTLQALLAHATVPLDLARHACAYARHGHAATWISPARSPGWSAKELPLPH